MSILTAEEIIERVKPIAKEFNVPEIYLFGSYARGEATHTSDIDLVFDATNSKATGILKKMQFKHALEKALNKEVDLLRIEAVDSVEPYLEDLKESFYSERILIHANKKGILS